MYILVLHKYCVEWFFKARVYTILVILEHQIIFNFHIILCDIFKYVVYSVSFKLHEMQQLK